MGKKVTSSACVLSQTQKMMDVLITSKIRMDFLLQFLNVNFW